MTLRTTSEGVETLQTGWNRLVGTDPDLIVQAVREARPQADRPVLYGDGHAAERIVDLLCTMRRG